MLDGDALQPGWSGWRAPSRATTLLAEVKESTTRISELVAAIKSYSQMDRASMQRIDVKEGLESTLVMLGHKLRDGVTVVREYGADVPQIDAYAGELNQVWTNLIDNAVDAMDGSGTLRVATRLDGDARGRRGLRHRHGHDAGGPGAGVRGVLHDQGRRHRAPGSGSTSPGGSWSTATAARSPSTPTPAGTVIAVRLPVAATR